MKKILYIILYFLSLTIFNHTAYSEGFSAETLVLTPIQMIPIKDIHQNDIVISPYNSTQFNTCPITDTHHKTISWYIKIGVKNIHINTAPDQKFFLVKKKIWVAAQKLKLGDILLCCNNKTICIETIDYIYEPITIYALSVNKSHIFYVSPHAILAHNYEPITTATTAVIAFAFPPAAPILLGAQIFSGIIAGIGSYFAYKKYKKQKAYALLAQETITNNSNLKPPNNNNDDDDDNNDHPHGIYHETAYHHENSGGLKSPPPKNGQKCLDYSLWLKDGLRISIENDTFVVLRQTSYKKFHGYAVSWGELTPKMKTFLRKNQYVTKSGKIIRYITKKALT